MKKKLLRKICVDAQGYSTPDLNDVLYFQCKGFMKIENLEEYTAVKCLYLQQNGVLAVAVVLVC